MQQQLRVDTVGVQAMASRWGASVGELSEAVAAAGIGLSCQASAAAVRTAHAEVTAFMAALGTQVGARASCVAHADRGYIVNEADSANQLAAVAHPVAGV